MELGLDRERRMGVCEIAALPRRFSGPRRAVRTLSASLALRAPRELFAQIDAWRAQQPDRPSRAEAVRILIEGGFIEHGCPGGGNILNHRGPRPTRRA